MWESHKESRCNHFSSLFLLAYMAVSHIQGFACYFWWTTSWKLPALYGWKGHPRICQVTILFHLASILKSYSKFRKECPETLRSLRSFKSIRKFILTWSRGSASKRALAVFACWSHRALLLILSHSSFLSTPDVWDPQTSHMPIGAQSPCQHRNLYDTPTWRDAIQSGFWPRKKIQ